jgi:hypothetical protein
MRRILIVLFLSLLTVEAHAASPTGNDFLQLNEGEQILYTSGFMDAYTVMLFVVCDVFPTRKITNSQARNVILKYLYRHPERRDETLYKICLEAITEGLGRPSCIGKSPVWGKIR